jgi:beta-glucosidase
VICRRTLTALTALVAVSGLAAPASLAASGDPVSRAKAIVARMTLDEKITEMHGIQDSNHLRYVPGIPRLGIPPLVVTNGPAGVGPGDSHTQAPATALPAPVALAAGWDAGQARQYGQIIGSEAWDLGDGLLEGPDVDIARVPQNGRGFEGFGEDPYLTGQVAAAEIQGIQAQQVIGEAKHFTANNQETNRFSVNEVIDERTLREIYTAPYEAAVAQGGSGAVMCAYPKVNGVFNCENGPLLTGVLRGGLGFGGFVTSDFGATHSAAGSANAGLNLEMPTGQYYGATLKAAVQSGQVSQATLDNLLVARFATMIRLGVFDRKAGKQPIPAAPDGAVARSLAEEGTVLLKNSGVLPLGASGLHSLAVIGPYAGKAMTGGGGSSHVDPLYTVDPVTGLRNRAGTGVTVSYDSGSNVSSAVAAAKAADVAVVMVGDSETEGSDRSSLSLPSGQDALVSAVAAANPRTVVVLKTGGPVLMPWLSQVPAVVEAWYPGEEDGNAVAAVLFGDVNPSGKLPITFPAKPGDVPAGTPAQYPGVNGTATYSEGVFVGYRHYDQSGIPPLFAFGYGLSYTTFGFSNLHVTTGTSGNVTVTADVTNTGSRAGSEVAQLYVGDPSLPGVLEPPNQLQGFAKVTLTPGQTLPVTFTLTPRAFSYWNTGTHAWTVAGGDYRINVGDSSRDLPLTTTIRLAGARG